MLALTLLFAACAAPAAQEDEHATTATLRTRWADQVSQTQPWPEYPRPQLQRDAWVNLNGKWDYAVRPTGDGPPTEWDGKILVPYPLESQLSGVGRVLQPDETLWYRTDFVLPREWQGELANQRSPNQILLHFGASDWHTRVWVNGERVAEHFGGYDPFTANLGEDLDPGQSHSLLVAVTDPSDTGMQPAGKQTLNPRGIWYTPVSGIWQTVWLEPVPALTALDSVRVTHLGGERLRLDATLFANDPVLGAIEWDGMQLELAVSRDGEEVATATGPFPGFEFEVGGLALWSPDDPVIYDLDIVLTFEGSPVVSDRVRSSFAARTVSVQPDEQGVPRLSLNGEPIFHYGLLDQGYWPDGLYTPPTEEAMVYDLQVTKDLGFNMIRKHVKVEPARWYWHADRMGLLVWQDIPSGGPRIRPNEPDLDYHAQEQRIFRREAEAIVDAFHGFPSIVCWVLFNEGWGQHDTEELTAWLTDKDPTRIINAVSGWADRGVGHVEDMHSYPGPGMPTPDAPRAAVLGEFGGLGLPVAGHTWVDEANWGYRSFDTRDALLDNYLQKVAQLRLLQARGLAAAVYTQTTDVETEVNGVMSYDREVLKFDDPRVRAAHAELYGPPPVVETLVPSALDAAEAGTPSAPTWHVRFEDPGEGWQQPGYNDADWAQRQAGFGTQGTPGARIGTTWDGDEIWLRRRFALDALPADGALSLSIHHDEDAEVWLNGVRIAALDGYTTGYVTVPLDDAARTALQSGENLLAIHCRQTTGGQYVDAGLVLVRARD